MLCTKEAQRELSIKRGDSSIEFVSEYIGDNGKHEVRCKKCYHEWETTPNTLKRKGSIGCPQCGQRKKLPAKQIKTEKYRQYIEKIFNFKKDIKKANQNKNKYSPSSQVKAWSNKLIAIQKERIEKEKVFMQFKNEMQMMEKELVERRRLVPNLTVRILTKSGREKNDSYESLKRDLYMKRYTLSNESSLLDKIKNSEIKLEEKLKSRSSIEKIRKRFNLKYGGKTKLYYIRLKMGGKYYYKIGITTNSVDSRFCNSEGKLSRAVDKIFFEEKLKNAEEIETIILKAHRAELANDPNLLRNYGGYSEIFNTDVLDLE